MADFDPNALVKAMGPQRDPYSWAELYATDASKHQLSQEELRARMLQQEMQRREHALDREQRGQLATESERGRNRRFKEAQKTRGAGRESRVQILPPGSHSAEEVFLSKQGGSKSVPIDTTGRRIVTIGGKSWYLPKEGTATATPTPEFKPRMVPGGSDRRSKYDDDEEED